MTLLVLLIIVILLVVVIRALLRDARDRRENEARQMREQEEAKRRYNAREASRLLKEINRSLGFPEGTGPTGIMVDGEYRVISVGHTERMKSDPTYALANELAGITLEMADLEAALKEADARSDISLAIKIRTELSHLSERAMAMADELEMLEKQQPSKALGAIESESNTLVEQHQREHKSKGWEMAQPVTMTTVADLLKELMNKWKEALQVTINTGYWKDTEACDLVVSAYGDQVANLLKGGKFSGDSKGALEAWTNLTTVEANYRREQMDIVRAMIPPPNPNIWWMVLECHPHAQPDDVKKAFGEKMKECHPERVAGMAPQIRELASDMAQKLTKAMSEYETRIR